MKTKAAILHTLDHPLDLVDVNIPVLREGQYLVKVVYTSICGSQINEIKGNKGKDAYLPHLLGHEAVGRVVDKHHSCTKINVGQNVICSWITGDGLEGGPVKYGKYNAGPIATFTEYAVVSENRLYRTEVITPEYSMFGCAIPTALGAIKKLDVQGKKVLVVGVGAVGLGIAINLSDFCDVFVEDLDSSKIQAASRYGKRYNYEGVDVVFDCTGSVDSLNRAMGYLDSGTLVVVGNPKRGLFMQVDPYNFIFGKQIMGHNGNDIDMDDFVRNIPRWNIDPYKDIMGDRFELEDINSALTHKTKPVIFCGE